MTISRNLSIFAANVTSTGTYTEFASGTLMLFQQTTAPTGWTKQTTHNDKALRVVTGSASSGGSSTFTAVFANQTPTITTSGLSAGATTLATTDIPSHSHVMPLLGPAPSGPGGQVGYGNVSNPNPTSFPISTQGSGGGGSHAHPVSGSATASAITLNVQYVDLIIASKS
jgi:hypothetical protein